MKVVFLGVGEAFDKDLPNNSHVIITEKTKLLLDCGFNIPQQLWKFSEDPNFLDAIYISHQHADHYFGLPAVLLRMWEDGRERDLTIICQKELQDSFQEFMGFAYRDFIKKFKYKINLVEARDGDDIKFNDLKLSFEKTVHSGENLAVKISSNGKTMAYSGDGSPIVGSDFYKNLDLLILETYLYDKEIIGHACVIGAIKFAEENSVKTLALVHLNKHFRKNDLPGVRNEIRSDTAEIIIPEPMDEYEV